MTCTVYVAQKASDAVDLTTISSCLESFLAGKIDDADGRDRSSGSSSGVEHQAAGFLEATEAAAESEDDDVSAFSDRTADADVIDDYLKPPVKYRHWQPLVLVLGVPAIHKGALIEVQPEVCTQDALDGSGGLSDSSSDDNADEAERQPGSHAAVNHRTAWAQKLVTNNGSLHGYESTSWASLSSIGAYCACQVALFTRP